MKRANRVISSMVFCLSLLTLGLSPELTLGSAPKLPTEPTTESFHEAVHLNLSGESSSARSDDHGPGNGTDGIYILYKEAADLGIEVMETVLPEHIEDEEIAAFYKEHRELFLESLQNIAGDTDETYLQVRDSVQARVNGELKDVKASTGSSPGSPVLISRSMHVEGQKMKSAIHTIFHEVGHHSGRQDENRDHPFEGVPFLDRFGTVLLDEMARLDPEFMEKIEKPIVVYIEVLGDGDISSPLNSAHVNTWFTLFRFQEDRTNGPIGGFPQQHEVTIGKTDVIFCESGEFKMEAAMILDRRLMETRYFRRVLGKLDTLGVLDAVLKKRKHREITYLYDVVDLLYHQKGHVKHFDVSRAITLETPPSLGDGRDRERRFAYEREKARIERAYGPKYIRLIKEIKRISGVDLREIVL